jgi:hypothetical protein
MVTALVVAGLLAVGSPSAQLEAAAANVQPAARASEPFSKLFTQATPSPETPRRLFIVPAARGPEGTPPKTDLDSPRRPRTKVVCGTTLIIVGSEPDPNMVKPLPETGTKYLIRRVPPRVCGQEK